MAVRASGYITFFIGTPVGNTCIQHAIPARIKLDVTLSFPATGNSYRNLQHPFPGFQKLQYQADETSNIIRTEASCNSDEPPQSLGHHQDNSHCWDSLLVQSLAFVVDEVALRYVSISPLSAPLHQCSTLVSLSAVGLRVRRCRASVHRDAGSDLVLVLRSSS